MSRRRKPNYRQFINKNFPSPVTCVAAKSCPRCSVYYHSDVSLVLFVSCLDLQQKSGSKTTKAAEEGRAQKKQKAAGACPYKRRVEDMFGLQRSVSVS